MVKVEMARTYIQKRSRKSCKTAHLEILKDKEEKADFKKPEERQLKDKCEELEQHG